VSRQFKRIKCKCQSISENYLLKKKEIKGGGIQYVFQCNDCGGQASANISHSSLTSTEKNGCQKYDYEFQSLKRSEIYEIARRKSNEEYELKRSEYHEYLQSEEWKKIRIERLEHDEYVCQLCGEEANTAHHLNYENIYHETIEDLVSVCKPCHDYIHSNFIMTQMRWPKVVPVLFKDG